MIYSNSFKKEISFKAPTLEMMEPNNKAKKKKRGQNILFSRFINRYYGL